MQLKEGYRLTSIANAVRSSVPKDVSGASEMRPRTFQNTLEAGLAMLIVPLA